MTALGRVERCGSRIWRIFGGGTTRMLVCINSAQLGNIVCKMTRYEWYVWPTRESQREMVGANK